MSVDEHLKRVAELQATGDVSGTLIELKNTLQDFPDAREARQRLGVLYARLGDGASARTEINKAVELGLSRELAEPVLIQALILEGKSDDALRRVDEIPGVEASADLLVLRGKAKFNLVKTDAALADFEAALRLDAVNAEALLGVARVHWVRKEPGEAQKYVVRSLVVEPDNANTHMLDGMLKLVAEQPAAALVSFKTSARYNPLTSAPWVAQARAHLALKQYGAAERLLATTRKRYAGSLLAVYYQGVAKYEQNELGKAADFFREVLSSAPKHNLSHFYLGMILYRTNQLEQAEELLGKFVAVFPEHQPTRKLLASIQLRLKKYDAAVETLTSGVESSQRDPEMASLWANALFSLGDVDRGIAALESAAELKPESAYLRTSLALIRLQAGRVDEAIAVLEQERKREDADLDAALMLSYLYIRTRQWDRAVEVAQSVLAAHPKEAAAYNALGLANIGKADMETARQHFEKALSLSPDQTPVLRNLAVLDFRNGKLDAAQEKIERVLAAETKPNTPATLTLAGQIAMARNKSDDARDLFEKVLQIEPGATEARFGLASYHLLHGEPQAAIEVTRNVTRVASRNPAYAVALGEALLQVGNYAQAAGVLDEAARGFPDSFPLRYAAGVAALQWGALEAAKDHFTHALELQPANADSVAGLAKVALLEHKDEVAESRIAELERLEPGSARLSSIKGDLAGSRGDFAEEARHYGQASAIENTASLALHFAFAQLRAGHGEEAIAGLETRLQAHPDEDAVALGLAEINKNLGRDDAARQTYEQLLKRRPDSVGALVNLARMKVKLGEPDAFQLAERAYRLAPENAEVADTYGWLLVQKNLVEAGLRTLKQAAELAPENAGIRYHYAVALAKQGDKRTALTELDTALQSEQFDGRDTAERLRRTLQGASR